MKTGDAMINVPLHASRLADGSAGCWRLRVALLYDRQRVKRRVEFGLRTKDRREAVFRACWILKGLVFAEKLYCYAVYAEGQSPQRITLEMVNEWLNDTGFMKREVRYGQRRARKVRLQGCTPETPLLPGMGGGALPPR